MNETQGCIRCEPNYYFDFGGVCIKCKTGDNCLYCNPDDPSKCMMC